MDKKYVVNTNKFEFLLGGRCETTIESNVTKVAYTYKLMRCKQEMINQPIRKYYVNVREDNGYVYAGAITVDYERHVFRYSKGLSGKYTQTHQAIRALLWVLRNCNKEAIRLVTIYHVGKCACCGKPLSTPDDLALGVGHTCRYKVSTGIA